MKSEWERLNNKYMRLGPRRMTALELAVWRAGEEAARQYKRLRDRSKKKWTKSKQSPRQ